MMNVKMALPLLTVLACMPTHVSATALLGQDLQDLSVFSNTYATTGANSSVFGSLMTGDVGTSGAGGYISGNFTAVGALTIGGNGSHVGGNMTAGGALTTGDAATVGGNVTAGGAASVGAASVISGNVAAAGAVSTGTNSQVNGNVQAGGAASIGVGASVGGSVAAVGAFSQGAGSTVPTQQVLPTPPVDAAYLVATLSDQVSVNQSQILAAQAAFSKMVTTTFLLPTITVDTTLFSGVYSADSLSTTAGTTLTLDAQNKTDQFWVFNIGDILSTGALSKIVMINGATTDSVIWNAGGYASLGADSILLGTLLARNNISVGAGAKALGPGGTCGGLFSALSYLSTGDGAQIGGSGCKGIAKGFEVDVDGRAYHTDTTPDVVPEPAMWALWMIGITFIGSSMRRKSANLVTA
jgi:cytoskeletal protein CcmA (bactofilin family)